MNDKLTPARGIIRGALLGLLIWAVLGLLITGVAYGDSLQQSRRLRDCIHNFDGLVWYPSYTLLTADDLNVLASRLDAPQTPIPWLGYECEHGPGQYSDCYWDTPTLSCQNIIPSEGLHWSGDDRFIRICESEDALDTLFIWTNSAPPTDNGVNLGYHDTCAAMVEK